MPAVPEEGQLTTLPMPRLLLGLWREQYAGTVTLSRDRIEKQIMLREGIPVFVESNLPSEALCAQLQDVGAIGHDDYARVVEHVKRERCQVGAALLALGLLDAKQLFHALREQVRKRIVECFGWPDGRFRLDRGAVLADGAQAFRVDPLVLIQDGIGAHWTPDRGLAELGSRLTRHATPSERFEALAARLRPTPEARALIEAIDPARSFGEALYPSLSAEALAAAWVLAETGALAFTDGPPRAEGDEEEKDVPPELDIEIEVKDGAADDAGDAADDDEIDAAALQLSPEAGALREELLEKHGRLAELDHYELLGVAPDAPDGDIKKAYFSLAKRVHPDALGRVGLGELRREANELFARIAQAYQTLSNPKRRQQYDAEAAADGPVTDASRVAQAEALYRKGEVLLKVGNFAGAADFLRPCVELWPDEADYQGALGWALYKKSPSEPEPARTHLERANELRADDPVLLFRLGVVLRKLGEADTAAELLDRAKSLERAPKG